MPLNLALVFHFNQHTNEYAHIADRACYRGLLHVLRAHPALKFNLHISGTLLRALNWLDPQTLDLVRAGIAEGQFELLGSTYAQNVPYVSDDWDNAQQIGLHREVLQAAFGVQPTVFWNSERTWRQSLIPLIVEGGYITTLVEDHILQAAGLTEPVPITTAFEAHSLVAVYDDTLLRERFNYAAWFGRRAQLFRYLKDLAQRPGSERFLLAYAGDAEAMGLWNWEQGYLPHAAWAHLDTLLRALEDSGAYVLRHLSFAKARQRLDHLPDRAAQWMNRALANPRLPYHEDGYHDWFDFVRRSPKVAYFSNLYGMARACLTAFGFAQNHPGFSRPARPSAASPGTPTAGAADPAATPAEKFYRQGIETFCHHQYEFGRIGVGGRHYWGWENVRTTFLFARLAQIAAEPRPRQWIEDINGDGSDEQLLCDGRYLAVLTGYGGRLIYWFDLLEARQWVGNQLAVPSAPYHNGSTKQPRLVPVPNRWLPESFEADLKPWQSLRTRERAPTRLGRRLPDWLFKREPAELTVYRRRMRRPGQRLPLRAQMGAFNDEIEMDQGEAYPPDTLFDYRLEPDGPCYLNYLMPGLSLEKRVRQIRQGLIARYSITNRAKSTRRLRLKSSHELCPDYRAVLAGGQAALSFFMFDDLYPGVQNHVTRTAVVLEASREWSRLEHSLNLLALEVWLTFDLVLAPHSAQELEIQLKICRV